MIREVRRDEIRMTSGRVMYADPIDPMHDDEVAESVRALNVRLSRAIGSVGDGFVIVTVYDRMDSVYAKSETVVFLSHIESITPRWVQVDEDEDE